MSLSGLGLWLTVVSACTFDPSAAALDGGPGSTPVDGAPGSADASAIDAGAEPDARICAGEAIPFPLLNIDGCDVGHSPGDLQLNQSGRYFLNTDTGVLRDPQQVETTLDFVVVPQGDGSELFVLSVDSFNISSSVRLALSGARPFVLVSLGDIDINGTLAARGIHPDSGAGGNLDTHCQASRGPDGAVQTDDNDNDAGSGGGGAGFAEAGGTGARVETSDDNDTPSGAASADLDLVPLRGGCAGGVGGDTNGGLAGGAGGAIQLVAAGTVTVAGRLTVSAGGGSGATVHGGGGGGGSGGGILLQATSLIVDGIVTANGGAGGEGSRTFDGEDGDDGRESDDNDATGGSGGSEGGNGGDGGARNDSPNDGSRGRRSDENAVGGGGGGGGVGVIRFVADDVDVDSRATVSPDAN